LRIRRLADLIAGLFINKEPADNGWPVLISAAAYCSRFQAGERKFTQLSNYIQYDADEGFLDAEFNEADEGQKPSLGKLSPLFVDRIWKEINSAIIKTVFLENPLDTFSVIEEAKSILLFPSYKRPWMPIVDIQNPKALAILNRCMGQAQPQFVVDKGRLLLSLFPNKILFQQLVEKGFCASLIEQNYEGLENAGPTQLLFLEEREMLPIQSANRVDELLTTLNQWLSTRPSVSLVFDSLTSHYCEGPEPIEEVFTATLGSDQIESYAQMIESTYANCIPEPRMQLNFACYSECIIAYISRTPMLTREEVLQMNSDPLQELINGTPASVSFTQFLEGWKKAHPDVNLEVT
jgi:hypothetical protein